MVSDNVEVKEIYQLNPEIYRAEKICIFGTGINAVYAFSVLAEKNIYADFFADRSDQCEKIGKLLNRQVLREDELTYIECAVIIASTFWREIAERLKRKGIHNLFIAPTVPDIEKQVIVDDDYLLSIGGTTMERDTLYICCPQGLGDTFYVASLAGSYKAAHSSVKKICLIVKENHGSVVSVFQGVDETIISNEKVTALRSYSLSRKVWRRRNYIYGHFTLEQLKEYDRGILEGNMVSLYKKYVLDLGAEREMEYPFLRKECLNDTDINKKTVIFMPYAESSVMLPVCFWERLGERLKELGYIIYTNVKDESEKVIRGTKRISEAVDIMMGLCEKSLATVSVRSGICDLLALTDTSLVIINTEKAHLRHWDVKTVTDRKDIFNLSYDLENDMYSLENDVLQIVEKLQSMDGVEMTGGM